MKKIWILTIVKRGFIQEPEIFYDELAANNRKKALMADCNPDYDELDIFEKKSFCKSQADRIPAISLKNSRNHS